jgi:predicted TIM-barrel enzyme
MENFQDLKRRRIPIVGGRAGTGLSAKCEEAGGIDLIVIYNSGRCRMAGRGSLAGLMAYGNAKEIVMEMAREVLPVLHDITPVNMNVMRIEAAGRDGISLTTKNRMRVDAIGEFFVPVGSGREAVAIAA